jgi:cytochrome b subunit of formate dehydrogenase
VSSRRQIFHADRGRPASFWPGPAKRFNGGQKLIYWIVVLGGAAMAVSGYLLMFPFYGTTIEAMQNAEMG